MCCNRMHIMYIQGHMVERSFPITQAPSSVPHPPTTEVKKKKKKKRKERDGQDAPGAAGATGGGAAKKIKLEQGVETVFATPTLPAAGMGAPAPIGTKPSFKLKLKTSTAAGSGAASGAPPPAGVTQARAQQPAPLQPHVSAPAPYSAFQDSGKVRCFRMIGEYYESIRGKINAACKVSRDDYQGMIKSQKHNTHTVGLGGQGGCRNPLRTACCCGSTKTQAQAQGVHCRNGSRWWRGGRPLSCSRWQANQARGGDARAASRAQTEKAGEKSQKAC